MKAAVWTGVNQIEIQDLPMPVIGDEEALIRVRAAGVCVTDYHIISGKLKIGHAPNVQGHEICGEIAEIHTTRTDLPVGQRCVIATSLGCGHCDYCRDGKQYICNDSSEIGYFPHHGGYAEYLKVPVSAIVPIPDEVSDRAAAILESTVCPTESLMRIGVPFAGTVFIAGAGPAALAFIMVSRLLGAGKIVSLVRSESNAARVKSFGATDVILTTETSDPEGMLRTLTDGNQADIAIDATGSCDIISRLPYYCRKGGTMILYGIPGEDELATLPVKKIVTEEMTICGAVGNTKAWYPLVKMIAAGRLDLEKLVTHTFRLEDIDKAFDLYRAHDRSLIKAIITFDH